jgi:SulP family sulfate permease
MQNLGGKLKNIIPISDVWGGLSASTMLLPQSMAFGVALLAPHGVSAAVGAMAGLLGAIALSMASGISGGTRGLVSSPTGPMLILLASAFGLIAGNIGTDGNILAALTALVVLTGIAQIIIGASGGGNLIKFIP